MMRPHVTIKFAATLDGKIAAADGSSRWISGPRARRFAHSLRAGSDAVLVGIGTVLADDPLLNVRLVKERSPVRIVIDTKLCIPLNAKIVKASRYGKTIIFTTPKAPKKKIEALKKKGVEVLFFPGNSVDNLLRILFKKGIKTVLVEGGSGIITSFLKAGLADRVICIISPKILGRGLNAVGDLGIGGISKALKFRLKSVKRLASDVVITLSHETA